MPYQTAPRVVGTRRTPSPYQCSRASPEDSIVLASSRSTEPTTRSTSYATESTKTSLVPSRGSTDSQSASIPAKRKATEPSSAPLDSRLRPARFTAVNDASNAREPAATQRSVSSATKGQASSRNVSGTTTLVGGDMEEPEQRLLDDGVKALDLEWDMPKDSEKNGAKQATPRRSTRSRLLSTASSGADKVKSVASTLGKRGRDALEEQKDKAQSILQKRQSLRPRKTEPDNENITHAEKATNAIYNMAGIAVDRSSTHGLVPRPAKFQKTSIDTQDSPETSPPPDEALPGVNPTRVKKWLSSGLYKGQVRGFDPKLTTVKNNRKQLSGTGKTKERTILPLPMFAGENLIETGRLFKLPFDIFSPLPPGQPKPDEWRKTQTNRFVGDAAIEWKKSKLLPVSRCCCTVEDGCGDDCQNRYMLYECDDDNCNIGSEHCTNRAFATLKERCRSGNKYDIGVEVMKTDAKGFGVRSCRTFEPNQIIVEYAGEIITQEECDRRVMNEYKNVDCYYLMSFDQNMIIDATRGSIARFVNHSCEPNCRMIKWNVSGRPRMALFAGDDGVMTGDELTYDYNFDPFKREKVQECKCGTPSCRGFLGPKPSKEKEKERASLATKAKLAAKSTSQKVAGIAAGTKRKIDDFFESDQAHGSPSKKARISNDAMNIDDTPRYNSRSKSDDLAGPIHLANALIEPNPVSRVTKSSEQARLSGKTRPNKKERAEIARFTFTHQQAVDNYHDALRALNLPNQTPSQKSQPKKPTVQKGKPYESLGFAGSAETVVPLGRQCDFDYPKMKVNIPDEQSYDRDSGSNENTAIRHNSRINTPGMSNWLNRVFDPKVAFRFTIERAKERKAREAKEEEEKKKKQEQEEEQAAKKQKHPEGAQAAKNHEPDASGGNQSTKAGATVGRSLDNPILLDAVFGGKENARRASNRTSMDGSTSLKSTGSSRSIIRRSSSSIAEEARKDLETSGELDNADRTIADSDESSTPLNPRPVAKKVVGVQKDSTAKIPEGIIARGKKKFDENGRRPKSVRLVD